MTYTEIIKNRLLIFDGAMGTMLQAMGLQGGELPEIYNMLYPDKVREIHKKYAEAGADIITTNTFGANRLKLKDSGYSAEEVVIRAVALAKEAAEGRLVALDIGPTGQLMAPMGSLSFEEAYDLFACQIKAGAAAGADIILIETMSDLYEAKAAVLAAKENSTLPVFCTMTFQEDRRPPTTLTGTNPITMVQVLEALGADVIGVNCSLGPREILPIAEEILKYASKPVLIQANAGLPKLRDGHTFYEISSKEFTRQAEAFAQKGAAMIGGCCGTTPDFIKDLKAVLGHRKPIKQEAPKMTTVCSSTKTIIIGSEAVPVGERINPSGKKRLQEALKKGDMGHIRSEAVNQKESGAQILDINVGMHEIDEKDMMVKVIREIQGAVDTPLQIDSIHPSVIEAAVRVYNGKPIINSVNGKKESMEALFPIAKKYGACIVGLTMDESGIPVDALQRVQIAGKIIEEAQRQGIPKENIIIDTLALTASAQQEEVMEAIKAIKMVKDRYGVKTTLGISNVSYGFPKRQLLNRTYLAMALAYGLDAPILDPLDTDMMDTLHAFSVLSNQDPKSKRYMEKYSNSKNTRQDKPIQGQKDLRQAIIDGLKEEALRQADLLLKTTAAIDIIDNHLIPALDMVGLQYEEGKIFLPQLLQSAETVKGIFDILKKAMPEQSSTLSKGRILLATVKGDVHDIGKNIVKILLENYGFEVLDLGKDVPAEEIIAKVKSENIRLVGLSALMTTTIPVMKAVIKALKDTQTHCTIMIGGAVLSESDAKLMGADFYSKDARGAVKIAQSVFGM